MAALDQIAALQLDGETVSLADVLRILGHAGRTGFLIDAARELLIERAAQVRGLSVSDNDLQSAADQFRARHNLQLAEDTRAWLADRNWTAEDLERHLELQLLRERLTSEIVTPEMIEQHFAEHRRKYDRVRLAHIVVAEQSLAEELAAQIDDEDADFAALARQFSTDTSTAQIGGEMGLLDRVSLSAPVESAVFSAADGDTVGPVETARGFHLIRIHNLIPGQLDDSMRSAIRSELFHQWLDAELNSAEISCPLFEQLASD